MPAPTTPIDRSTRIALIAMGLGVFVIANDFTALSVAVPEIEKSFGTTLTHAQWVINGYALVFGVLIVTGGRLADLFGRKRMFMIGATIFAGFSLMAGSMPNVQALIGCRALMGVGGAIMWPAILGMTYALLPEDRAGLAGGLLLGVAGLGNAFGPMLGGVLTDVLTWRWIFFVNVPVAGFAMWVTWRHVAESRVETTERRIDYLGIAVLSIGIVSILLALDQGPDDGFGDPLIITLFVVGALLLLSFLAVERGVGGRALVPTSVLENRLFAGSCVAVLLMSAIFFAALLYLPQLFEKILGYTALASGAGLLPMMGVFAASSFVAGSLYERLGPRVVVGSGACALAVGMFVLSFVDAGSGYASLIPGMAILGLGIGLFYSSMTTVAVTALDPTQSSLAGGIVYMCQIAGGAVGLAVNTAIVVTASDLPTGIRAAFRVDAVLAVIGLLIILRLAYKTQGRHERSAARKTSRWHHRAHA